MVKAPCEKIGLKRGKWTDEEDELLVKYIQANGEGSWRSLPKNAGLLRCGKSCRLRWTNYLRPNLKRGKFTAEEDETIVKLHSSLGNRWSLIAQHLSSRTDNEIKNYWISNLRRRIYTFRNLKELIKTTPSVPKIELDGDCDESSRKQATTTSSKRGGSIGSLLPGKDIVDDIGSSRKTNSSLCLGGKGDTTLFEGGSIEFLLPKNCTIDIGPIQKSNSLYPEGKDDDMWSRVGSIESPLPEDTEKNSSYPGGKDDAMWSEKGGLFESLLLKNLEINPPCSGGTDNASWSEEGSIESFMLESYIVDISSNRETNSSCLGSRDEAMWYEEGSSIESLLMKNYIVDLGLAMQQQHEHHAKLEIHDQPRNEEEEDKNNKDIHVIPKQQVCNGVWTFKEQGQQTQGPHEQNKGSEIVLLQQLNECVYNFDNNWPDINFDYFLEEEHGVYTH